MTDRVGHKIGNYRLVRLLGEGGFAEVHLAEYTYLGSYAAIKLLYVRVAPEDIAQFQQEGRMLAALLHPHIVRVLDFAIEVRITQTDAKLKRNNVSEENQAILTHHDVGHEVRTAIERIHQKKPEDLPRVADLRNLLEEKRRKTRKRIAQQKQVDDEGQGRLF